MSKLMLKFLLSCWTSLVPISHKKVTDYPNVDSVGFRNLLLQLIYTRQVQKRLSRVAARIKS